MKIEEIRENLRKIYNNLFEIKYEVLRDMYEKEAHTFIKQIYHMVLFERFRENEEDLRRDKK